MEILLSNIFKFVWSIWHRIGWHICNHWRNSVTSWAWAQSLFYCFSLGARPKAVLGSIFLIYQWFLVSSWSWDIEFFLFLVPPFHWIGWLAIDWGLVVGFINSWSWHKLLTRWIDCSLIFEFHSHNPLASLNCLRGNIISLHGRTHAFASCYARSLTGPKSPKRVLVFDRHELGIVGIGRRVVTSSPHRLFLIVPFRCPDSPLRLLRFYCFVVPKISAWAWHIISTWFFKSWT